MSNSQKKKGYSPDTPKNRLLISSFVSQFPGVQYNLLKTQGIYYDGVFSVTRNVCASKSKFSLSQYFTEKDLPDNPEAIWGLCGVESTQGDKASDTKFFLCRKTSEYFFACAILYFCDDPASLTGRKMDKIIWDVSIDLQEKVKERVEHSQMKKERKRDSSKAKYNEEPKKKKRRTISSSCDNYSCCYTTEPPPNTELSSVAEQVPYPESSVTDEAKSPTESSVESSDEGKILSSESDYLDFLPHLREKNNNIEEPQFIYKENQEPLDFGQPDSLMDDTKPGSLMNINYSDNENDTLFSSSSNEDSYLFSIMSNEANY